MKTRWMYFGFGASLFFAAAAFADIPRDLVSRQIGPWDYADAVNPSHEMDFRIQALDALELRKGASARRTWHDNSWLLGNGMIAARYSDPEFNRWDSSKSQSRYVLETKPLRKVVRSNPIFGKRYELGILSPSEKYDLLVGDLDGTFTRAIWGETARYVEEDRLSGWMGICEGSAAASSLYPEPKKSVTLMSADGVTPVTFSPKDIKGLASMLWSTYVVPTIPIAGMRCGIHLNPQDGVPENSDNCFTPNPGLWHAAVIHFLGKSRGPLIIDQAPDSQVWNFMVTSYSFEYFNPQTRWKAKTWSEAMVSIADFKNDKFKKHRSSAARGVVGVKMRIDATGEFNYEYDLEIDENGMIIGGEWYSLARPDFMWTIPAGMKAVSIADRLVGEGASWDGSKIPDAWKDAIHQSSTAMQPMALIVEKLIQLSAQ